MFKKNAPLIIKKIAMKVTNLLIKWLIQMTNLNRWKYKKTSKSTSISKIVFANQMNKYKTFNNKKIQK